MNRDNILSTRLRLAYIFSAIVAVLSIVASLGGLLLDNLYQDNLLVVSTWYGNDLITLVVAVPTLVTALFLAWQGSPRAQLVWLGTLVYTLYNYGFYLFGSTFNHFFLIYVALFTLSIFALIFALGTLDVWKVAQQFRPRTPVKWIGGYILLVVLFLGGFWIALSLNYVFTRQVPPVVVAVDANTNIIAALDLSLIVPFGILSTICLWKHQPWGYVTATIWNINGAIYMLALSAATISTVKAGAAESLLPVVLWGSIGIGCLIASVSLLANLKNSKL